MKELKGRRRVLVIAHLPPPIHGASIISDSVVRSTLIRQQFELEIIPLRFATSIDDLGSVRVGKIVAMVKVSLQIVMRCILRRPRFVYFTLAPVGLPFLRDACIVTFLRAVRIPHLLHLHGKGVAREARSPFRRVLYRWVFGKASIIHLSPLLYEDISEFVPKRRCHFVANGIVDAVANAGLDFRSHLDGPLRILFLSNMAVEKGPLVLLDALRLLKEREIPFTATFAGAWANDSCRRNFQPIVDRHGLKDVVCYVGPRYGREKVGLFESADVFVFPSHYRAECFPLAVLEAMSHGLPVVATREGAIAEIVIEGETGCLVPQRDAASLAERLTALAKDRVLLTRMGIAGRLRFKNLYTEERFERQICKVLMAFSDSIG